MNSRFVRVTFAYMSVSYALHSRIRRSYSRFRLCRAFYNRLSVYFVLTLLIQDGGEVENSTKNSQKQGKADKEKVTHGHHIDKRVTK